MLGHSDKCLNLTTYWDGPAGRCVPCPMQPGHAVSDNCGRDDDGSFHEPGLKPCLKNTFNDGTSPRCSPCSSCPSGFKTVRECSGTADTVCVESSNKTANKPFTTPTPSLPTLLSLTTVPPAEDGNAFIILAVVFGIIVILAAFIIYWKTRKGQCIKMCLKRGPLCENQGLDSISYSASTNDVDILSDSIQSAPLQVVLDNLDVLEELIILLDPETQGIKNTKHLASLCSFPATWVTYAYSMRESKSPLKAVLERLISSHPDWTVGDLANLLRKMERNDSIVVLSKLRPTPHGHWYF